MSGAPAGDPPGPLAQVYVLYERAEATAADLAERVVGSSVFAELLATTATNTMALAGVLNSAVDRAVRATRFAARTDLVSLGRQLGRTEDKLEHVLQAVEELTARLDTATGATPTTRANGTAAPGTSRSPRPRTGRSG